MAENLFNTLEKRQQALVKVVYESRNCLTNEQIAERANLPLPTASRHLAKLRSSGVIGLRHTVAQDYQPLSMLAMVSINIDVSKFEGDYTNLKEFVLFMRDRLLGKKSLYSDLSEKMRVDQVYTALGGKGDVFIFVAILDSLTLNTFVGEVLLDLPGVISSHTCLVFPI